MDIDTMQESINKMNNCQRGKPMLPRVTARQLETGVLYAAPIIKKVNTKHGQALVIENNDFSMFMPRQYLKIAIPESIPRRCFTISGYKSLQNGMQTPELVFSIQ